MPKKIELRKCANENCKVDSNFRFNQNFYCYAHFIKKIMRKKK